MASLNKQRFWTRVQQLTAGLLLLWLLVNLLGPWFARDLDGWVLFGSPVRSWVVAQAGVLFFLLIIVVYLRAMERLESRFLRDADCAAEPTESAPR